MEFIELDDDLVELADELLELELLDELEDELLPETELLAAFLRLLAKPLNCA